MVAKSASAGGLAGFLGSLVGLGGGFVAIPALTSTSWLGLGQHAAHGTSLCTAVSTGAFGAWGFYDEDPNNVDWEAAAVMAAAGAVSSRFAAKYATKNLSPAQLKKAMGAFMISMGVFTPARPYVMQQLEAAKKARAASSVDGGAATSPPIAPNAPGGVSESGAGGGAAIISGAKLRELANLTGVGLGTGVIAGVFGVGGGAVLVPALSMLLPDRIKTHKQALATSLAAMVPVGTMGAITHYRLGNIPYPMKMALPLAAGSALGSYLSALYVAGKMNDEHLRILFGVLIGGMGARTLRQGLKLG